MTHPSISEATAISWERELPAIIFSHICLVPRSFVSFTKRGRRCTTEMKGGHLMEPRQVPMLTRGRPDGTSKLGSEPRDSLRKRMRCTPGTR